MGGSRMHLQSLELFGFKSFADKTLFNFHEGVTAILGPNGCGKSNIVDAILWGLGEPNARNIRAQTSQEIIFSGSSKRKPIGFAEVTLVFDNEDGTLAVDEQITYDFGTASHHGIFRNVVESESYDAHHDRRYRIRGVTAQADNRPTPVKLSHTATRSDAAAVPSRRASRARSTSGEQVKHRKRTESK